MSSFMLLKTTHSDNDGDDDDADDDDNDDDDDDDGDDDHEPSFCINWPRMMD